MACRAAQERGYFINGPQSFGRRGDFDRRFHAQGGASTGMPWHALECRVNPTLHTERSTRVVVPISFDCKSDTCGGHQSLFSTGERTFVFSVTLIGRISNGVVVLPSGTSLPEGTAVEVRRFVLPKTGRELVASAWVRQPRLTPDEAEAFARDVENGRAILNRPPRSPIWE